jgi:hypothetical protein
MNDRVENLLHRVGKLLGGQGVSGQGVCGRNPFRDDCVPV